MKKVKKEILASLTSSCLC